MHSFNVATYIQVRILWSRPKAQQSRVPCTVITHTHNRGAPIRHRGQSFRKTVQKSKVQLYHASSSLHVDEQRDALGEQVLRAVEDVLREEDHVALIECERTAEPLEQRVAAAVVRRRRRRERRRLG